jgi:predicted dithiol-disulfide oxidoreductase (DUF899 family)
MARYNETRARLAEHRKRIADLRREMRALQAATEPEPVEDYTLSTVDGPVRLSALFGDKDDLVVIHNMGRSCPNCTMWADGFNGIHRHLGDRVAFVVSSPDPPDIQQRFAASRGWGFRMVSHAGTGFAADLGYRTAEGGWLPGLSVFRRDGERILRVADASFSPGDDFCTVWHVLDLLPEGAADWGPQFEYG